MSFELAATLSNTCRVCEKLSLCPIPSNVSAPSNCKNCGKINCNNPASFNKYQPLDGTGVFIIFCSSSVILSCETIVIRSAIFLIAANVSSVIVKFNCVANRIARIIRSGSSSKVCSGAKGVLIIFCAICNIPSNGSTKLPKFASLISIAKALIVKSLLF